MIHSCLTLKLNWVGWVLSLINFELSSPKNKTAEHDTWRIGNLYPSGKVKVAAKSSSIICLTRMHKKYSYNFWYMAETPLLCYPKFFSGFRFQHQTNFLFFFPDIFRFPKSLEPCWHAHPQASCQWCRAFVQKNDIVGCEGPHSQVPQWKTGRRDPSTGHRDPLKTKMTHLENPPPSNPIGLLHRLIHSWWKIFSSQSFVTFPQGTVSLM